MKIFKLSWTLGLLWLTLPSFGQNFGFEAPPSTPPLNWVAVTGTWRTVTDTVRTGNQAMAISAPATTGTTAGSGPAAQIVNSQGGTFLVTILWARSNEANNARVNIGFRRNTTNTLNPSATTAGQAPNMGLSWTRISSVSSAAVAAGPAGPAIRAFRSQANPTGTTIYIDDMIIYESATPTVDTFAPRPVAQPLFTSANTISWVNAPDSSLDASGRGGIVIVRATGANLPAPFLNDQAMYARVQGEAGVASFTNQGNTWTVVASINDTTATSFTDTSAVAGTLYTYYIFNRDRAFNYSSAALPQAACAGQPSAGTISINAASIRCVGDSLFLNSTVTPAAGIQYAWQQAPLAGGAFVNIPGQTGTSIALAATSSARYRCIASCSASGLGDTSNVIQVTITPNVVVGPINSSQTGTTYTFRVNNAANYTSLLWNFDDGATDTGMVVTHTFTNNRLHVVKVIGSNACSLDSSALAITIQGVSVKDLASANWIRVYPNPANEKLNIRSEFPLQYLQLTNLQGQLVLKKDLAGLSETALDLGELPIGVYMLLGTTSDNKHYQTRIQISR